ncbi:MAG: metallophosphoesterase family protein [Sphingobacteriales bacterium]|nr:metallophosphoesterase family protein [Sphingobacteriales bacterium]
MRKFFQWLLRKPVYWLAEKLSSDPNRERIHTALSNLYKNIKDTPGKKGLVLELSNNSRFIIFSDQHKGAKNGSDDFMFAEKNYLAALDYYHQNNFHFISLGDNEELWENTLSAVKKNNIASFEKEKLFLQRKAFTKIFGNHDLYWNNDPFASWQLKRIYSEEVKIYEGIILQSANSKPFEVFLTHGHQGDGQSDGNKFSAWFAGAIWAPLQAYLNINPNTPAVSEQLKTVHNRMMYDWSAEQDNLLLITGHTHQPVFESLTHLERLYQQLALAINDNNAVETEKIKKEISWRKHDYNHVDKNYHTAKPSYFNTGCCCFSDGDITGIEIADGIIRLIKWGYDENKNSVRAILEETTLAQLISKLS